jgi:hypothetical protein
MNKKGRDLQGWKVFCAELVWPFRRVERVREKEKTLNQSWFTCRQNGRLPPSVGMAAQEDSPCSESADRGNGRAQSGLVTF